MREDHLFTATKSGETRFQIWTTLADSYKRRDKWADAGWNVLIQRLGADGALEHVYSPESPNAQ